MAKNEAASREINEEIEEAHQLDPPGRRFQIACECALQTCGRVVTITVDEYRHVRMDPRQFAVVPEHFIGGRKGSNMDLVLIAARDRGGGVATILWIIAAIGVISLGDLATSRNARGVLADISAAPPNN